MLAMDELAIRKLVARLAQATDDRDEAAYRSCLDDTVTVGHAEEDASVVPAATYAHDAIRRAAATSWTHHKLFNPVIDIAPAGDRATASIDVVVEMSRPDSGGRQRRTTIGGRYRLGFVRTDGEWRIDRRAMRQRYVDGDPGEF